MSFRPPGFGGPPPGDGLTVPPDVPLRGLRRNARALTSGLILLFAIGFLLPDLSPPPTQPPAVELLRGRILALLPTGGDPSAPDVRLLVLDGSKKGQTIEGHLQGPSGQGALPRYAVGDEVIINDSLDAAAPFISVADLYRIPALALLLGLFAVAVTLVGGWRGVRSLIALALTLAVIVKIVVPLILGATNRPEVAILAATGVTIVTFVLTEGSGRRRWRRRSARSPRSGWWPASPSPSTRSRGSRPCAGRRT